jgi:DNA-binding transcriptional ArsR family regulator
MRKMTRSEAANACLAILDAEFFKALSEPSRLKVVRRLIRLGRADIGAIAEGLPQDRSVVSRHLQALEEAGLAISGREGRHIYYELDGPAILKKLGAMAEAFAPLVPVYCPGPKRIP